MIRLIDIKIEAKEFSDTMEIFNIQRSSQLLKACKANYVKEYFDFLIQHNLLVELFPALAKDITANITWLIFEIRQLQSANSVNLKLIHALLIMCGLKNLPYWDIADTISIRLLF